MVVRGLLILRQSCCRVWSDASTPRQFRHMLGAGSIATSALSRRAQKLTTLHRHCSHRYCSHQSTGSREDLSRASALSTCTLAGSSCPPCPTMFWLKLRTKSTLCFALQPTGSTCIPWIMGSMTPRDEQMNHCRSSSTFTTRINWMPRGEHELTCW